MKKNITILFACFLIHLASFCQPCFQPGSLVSVRTTSSEKFDYIIFKFLKPHSDKGILTGGNPEFFTGSNTKKSTYHKIAFNLVTHLCDNKMSLVALSKRLLNFKVQQKTQNMVAYGFELSEKSKITAHFLMQQRDMYFVKIRIE